MRTAKIWELVWENIIFVFFFFKTLTLYDKFNRTRTFLCFAATSCIIVCFLYAQRMGSTTSQIVIFVYRILFISYCFKEAFSNKVFHVCLTCFISIFADQLNYVLVHILDKEFEFNLQYSHFSTVVYVALELILMLLFVALLKVYSKYFEQFFSFFVIATAFTLLISTYLLSQIINMNPDVLPLPYQLKFNNISILIFLLFLSTLLLNEIANKIFTENMQLAEQLHLREKNAEKNRALLESAGNLHKWKHDYTNHLITMKGLLEKQSYSTLSHYIETQLDNLPETFATIETGHQTIDAILSNKYALAQTKNISFRYSVLLPTQIPLNDIELTGVIGNLLDNALDACGDKQLTTSPYIEFNMKPKRSMLKISVKNSSSGNYIFNKDGTLETTKEEKESHGKGLTNIISIIETHSGFYQFEPKEDSFLATICIPI